MGQRQDIAEPIYGDDCLGCYPTGKTPKYKFCRFSEVKTCPDNWCTTQPSPPNDHCFRLTQKETNACQWEYKSSQWWIEYYSDDPTYHRSFLVLRSLLPVHYYLIFSSLTDDNVPCQDFFNNQLSCGDIYNCGHDGFAIVTDRQESLDLMELLNIKVHDNLFLEMRPLANADRVYKFCQLKDATNVKILYRP